MSDIRAQYGRIQALYDSLSQRYGNFTAEGARNANRLARATTAWGRYSTNIENAYGSLDDRNFVQDYVKRDDKQYSRRTYMGLNDG